MTSSPVSSASSSCVDLSDYVSYNVSDEELESYGLDAPELTVTVDYLEMDDKEMDDQEEEVLASFTLSISRDPAELAAAGEDTEDEEITAYLRIGDSRIVYQIGSDDYEALMAASYDDLRHLEVLTADFADITQVDIFLESEDYSLILQEPEETEDEQVWLYQEEETDISALQSALEAQSADSFTAEKPSEKMEIGLTVYLDNEQYPQVFVQLYRYDGTYCLAVVDGEPVSLVPRPQVVDLIEAINGIVL